jgi:hypothetical protein
LCQLKFLLNFGKFTGIITFPPLKEGEQGGVSLFLLLLQRLIPPSPPFFKGGYNSTVCLPEFAKVELLKREVIGTMPTSMNPFD